MLAGVVHYFAVLGGYAGALRTERKKFARLKSALVLCCALFCRPRLPFSFAVYAGRLNALAQMRAKPIQKILSVCCAVGDRNEHIGQLAGAEGQIIAIPFQKKLCHHGADPLIAVHKRMIGCKTKAKPGDLFRV